MAKKTNKPITWQQAFGRALQTCRQRSGKSQEQFGFDCGLDRTYISGIERGIRNPSLKNIVRIADALGMSPTRLFEDAERIRAGHTPKRRRPHAPRA